MNAHASTTPERYAKYIMQNAGLDETQAGIKIAGRNINNRRILDPTKKRYPMSKGKVEALARQ